MAICKRCKGKGFGNWRPQDGKCFECEGFGDMGIYQKWKEQRVELPTT
ncbi:hypothetical protein [Evansella clarkii]|nr:hypothetical protein [Evansella clarkii]